MKDEMKTCRVHFSCKALVLLVAAIAPSGTIQAESAIDSIVKAPIVADGDVRERATDFVINLNVSLDPSEPGISLAAEDKVHVLLPEGFVFDEDALEDFPICSVNVVPCQSNLIPDACTPGTLACTTAVFLQGYPQSPVLPNVSRDGNSLILEPRGAIGPVVKQIHLIAKAIFNPGPGKYDIQVRHTNKDGDIVGEGTGRLHILPMIRPSINITSVFADPPPPFENTIYQTVSVGTGETKTAFPWNFLIWDRNGEPYTGIELLQITEDHYLMRSNGRTIGHASIDTPDGATGYSITDTVNTTITTPVIGIGPGGIPAPLVQRFEVQFDTGVTPVLGRYTTKFRLNNGNEAELFVDVVE